MTKINAPLVEDIIIERDFDAPRALVWRYWSEADLMRRWWGPETFTAPAVSIDFRVGGRNHNCMRSPDGKDYWSTGTYLEIAPLERIVCTDSFADEAGNIVSGASYGMGDDWPEVLRYTLTFADGDKGGTRFRLHHEGIPAGEMHTLCTQGWNEQLDKMAAAMADHQEKESTR